MAKQSRITIVKKQRDREGNIWLRDNYGGWTNEYGVRFTKSEHRRFGYEIRKANRQIKKYLEKYPTTRLTKETDLGSRMRKSDLSRFRRKSAYKNYLKVTRGIASGYVLEKRNPNIYRNNLLKAFNNPNTQLTIKQMGLKNFAKELIAKIKGLTPQQLIKLSKNPLTPDINAYYVVIGDVQMSNLRGLEKAIEIL